MKASNWDPNRLWRLPAALSTVALVAVAAWPMLDRFPSGTSARETVAFVLAVGCCAAFLGLGLGLWLAVRLRSANAIAAGVWSVFVALVWWFVVFGPLLRPPTGD